MRKVVFLAQNSKLPQKIIPLIIKLSGIQEDKKVNVIIMLDF